MMQVHGGAETYVTTAEMLRAEGEARDKVEDTFVVFEQRGIDVDDESRELIESCTDLDTLNGWFRRAFKVSRPGVGGECECPAVAVGGIADEDHPILADFDAAATVAA